MTAAVQIGNCLLDVTKVGRKLYQGSQPVPGPSVRRCGFDVLVLAAKEIQPPPSLYPGVEIVRARIDDSGPPLTREEWIEAVRAGRHVAGKVVAGQRVLTTCAKGLNRSGMVNAIALHLLTGRSGAEIVDYLRKKRQGALSNRYFVHALSQLTAKR